MTTAKRTLPLSKRGFNFETIMWFFTRLSAFAMYAFMLAGVIGALIVSAQTKSNFGDVLRWALLPNVVTPNPLSGMPLIGFLAKLMVLGFIAIVAAHGVHGILAILDDYFTSDAARRAFRNMIIVLFAIANLIAIYGLFFAAK
jgi:succinate dehydrogenase hydrophobic anchor subunit